MARRALAVIVPSHRSGEVIGECLDALEAQVLDRDLYEVHVVDSGLDDALAIVESRSEGWNGRLHLHAASPRSGPGEKRNLAAAVAKADYLAFTDADCAPDPAWLRTGLAHLERGAAIVQGPTMPPPGTSVGDFDHYIEVRTASPLYESCNVMYEAGAFHAAGGFPTALFDATGEVFGEDAGLAWRVRRSGGASVFALGCVVRHQVRRQPYSRHLAAQWRARLFPGLIRGVPELRRELLSARLFLGRRSLRYDAAVLGILLARRFPPSLALVLPYAMRLARTSRSPASIALRTAVKLLLADTVRAVALVWGSARSRSPVL